uniref:P1 n=1 Tax=Cucurbit aphid-borne yellows virus TaxID=91753 RepID=A0A7G7Y7V5_9VIRU|nr:P1 [Cucurbit aphid-borne yellows virus]
MVSPFFVFSLLVCLCSSVSSYQGTMFTPLEPINASYWLGSTGIVEPLSPPQVQLIYDCPPEKMLRDFSSRDITLELWERGYNGARQTSLEVMLSLKDSSMSGARSLRAGLESLLHATLKALTYVWSSLIWATACAIWYLLRGYTIEMLLLASLYMCTVYMVKMAAWIFGDLPISLLKAGLTTARGILRVLWVRRSYKAEKSVEGFSSYTIPQTPPGKSVLQVQHQDGSHAGYATCVALFNGSTGLLTAHHVITPGAKIVSTRNGSKIPASEFRIKLENKKRDLILMTGPPNWEGALACKAAQMQTASNLCKCKATFFAWNGGDWESSNAEIVGVSACRNYVSVLSNTNPGHSGTPYFNGKTLLGVHIGGANEENANYLAPIPAVPGLTSPKYVFETTAPQGRLFNDEEIAALIEEFSMSEVASIMKTRKGKQVYAEEAAPQQGNENAAATAQTTGPHSATRGDEENSTKRTNSAAAPSLRKEPSPPEPSRATSTICGTTKSRDASVQSPDTTASSETLSEIKNAILERINLQSIEKQVVEALTKKATKNRGRRQSNRKPSPSKDSSTPNTSGSRGQERKKPLDSNRSAASPSFIAPSKRRGQNGGPKYADNTQKWRPIPRGSGGQSSAPRPN